MFLKKREHARIMARLKAHEEEEEERELMIAEGESPCGDEAQAHFTLKFDEKNKPFLEKVPLVNNNKERKVKARPSVIMYAPPSLSSPATCGDTSCHLIISFTASPSPFPCHCQTASNSQNSQNSRWKPYRCQHGGCRKSYHKLSHLKAHTRLHTGERPFACPYPDCQRTFARSDELSRHKRGHSGVKSFVCRHCDKAFMRSDHLSKHEVRHERRGARVNLKLQRHTGTQIK